MAPAPGDVGSSCGGRARSTRPEGFAGDGYAVSGDVVTPRRRAHARWSPRSRPLAQRAPSAGCVVLHCAAVRVAGGVALFAPPGTERPPSRRSRAGAPSPTTRWWRPPGRSPRRGLPSPATAAPSSTRRGARCAGARLARAGRAPGFEWLPRSGATVVVMRHSARAPARDALAGERFVIASALARVCPSKARRGGHARPRDLDPSTRRLRRSPCHDPHDPRPAALATPRGGASEDEVAITSRWTRTASGCSTAWGSFLWERCDNATVGELVDAPLRALTSTREAPPGATSTPSSTISSARVSSPRSPSP